MTPEQIKAARKRLKMSPCQFTAALGFTGKSGDVTCCRWEKGTRKPSAQTITIIKQLLKKQKAAKL